MSLMDSIRRLFDYPEEDEYEEEDFQRRCICGTGTKLQKK